MGLTKHDKIAKEIATKKGTAYNSNNRIPVSPCNQSNTPLFLCTSFALRMLATKSIVFLLVVPKNFCSIISHDTSCI